MKIAKKSLTSVVAAGAIAAGSLGVATPALAEVSASVGIANMYLWRGIDLGDGDAAVSGDLSYSSDIGVYGGVWASSGDAAAGTEYDLYVGYGTELGGVSIDVSLWTYVYPDGGTETLEVDSTTSAFTGALARNVSQNDTIGDLSEVIYSFGFGGASLSIYDNVAGGSGYFYYTLGYSYDKYSVTYGIHSFDDDDNDMSHLDLSYAYNDSLSFTLSQVVDEETDGQYDDDLNVVVSYSVSF